MKRHVLWFAGLALLAFGLDCWTKTLVLGLRGYGIEGHVRYAGSEIWIIPGFLSYGHAYNEGVVWSFGPQAKYLWLALALLAIPAITLYFLWLKPKHWVRTACLGMVLGGAAGNALDRLLIGAVRDFIKVIYWVHDDGRRAVWPLFNLADSFIVVGAILLAIEMMAFDDKPRRPAPAPSAPSPGAPVAGATDAPPRT
ncbi:MAG TPA: signal peptidase II [Planctomycetota bacterium]|nr:signal peptidase II [Planctomycetota bacterium]